jgi:hypothetical protein
MLGAWALAGLFAAPASPLLSILVGEAVPDKVSFFSELAPAHSNRLPASAQGFFSLGALGPAGLFAAEEAVSDKVRASAPQVASAHANILQPIYSRHHPIHTPFTSMHTRSQVRGTVIL